MPTEPACEETGFAGRTEPGGRPQAPLTWKGDRMNFGLRGLLLLLATILFVVAALNNDNFTDLVSVGLAVLAGAFLVEETGFGRMLGSRRVG
jgi:hypothetical protein